MATAGPGTGGSRSQTASPRVQGAFPWPPFPAIESLPCSWHGGPGQHHEQDYGTEDGTSYGRCRCTHHRQGETRHWLRGKPPWRKLGACLLR